MKIPLIIFLYLLSFDLLSQTRNYGQCKDTLIQTPRLHEILSWKIESHKDGLYISETKTNRQCYDNAIRLQDSARKYMEKGCSGGCYFIGFDTDSTKLTECCITADGCFTGLYKSYYKNGKIKETGNYSLEHCERKIDKWLYYSMTGELIKQETFDKEGFLKSESSQNVDQCLFCDSATAKRDIKNGKIKLLLSGGISPFALVDQELIEKKYHFEYYDFGCTPPPKTCIIEYNKIIFNHFDTLYKDSWRKEIRKDVVGLKNYDRRRK